MASDDAYVYVYDRRSSTSEGKTITIGGVFGFSEFRDKILQTFNLQPDDEFVITTTNRNVIADDEDYVNLIESADTLYILKSVVQPLAAPVAEKIEFQPHYDTLIKSGIYEYYASEGHINPLPFAFAELIDNALAATVDNKGSRNIELSLHFDDSNAGNHAVCVTDNGVGMTSRQLNNWAIYRLSKFNRTERHPRTNLFEDALMADDERQMLTKHNEPKSLNSDISWFGVGGKQAIFFIGSSTRIITRPKGSCDVHEFTLSKDEFKRKEANKETIYSGYIRNRPPCDYSHIPKNEEITKKLINSENSIDWKKNGFTNVVITGIDSKHVKFMKQDFGLWTRQLAHIYHYYIHGPEGNTKMSKERRNVGALDVNITISIHERGKPTATVNLHDINDDLESQYIRTAFDTFEFKVKTDGGSGIVEGSIRYHPFLYDKETFPSDPYTEVDVDGNDDIDDVPARGRRPIFECFWNGRLIPYTFIDDFDWCRLPKKRGNIPNDCFYRISGCLFTNDKFKVSTNKLTFIDLEGKLRDRSTVFSRVILGQEQRAQIHRQFMEWLKECHEKHDKQIKFLNFVETSTRYDTSGRKNSQLQHSVYTTIEWDGKSFKQGQLVRTHRTTPIISGRIKQFILSGTYEGDVYAVGGEVEIQQEPFALYNEIRRFPLSKLDREVSSATVAHLINEEEGKLPEHLHLTWPEGNEIVDGESRQSGVTIGAMRIEIRNRRKESIQKLPSNAGSRKLLLEQRLLYETNDRGKIREITSHVTTHAKTWPYWFKKMENIKALGTYTIQLRTMLNESGVYTYADGCILPQKELKFIIREAPPSRFLVGMLESPLRIGEPFDIPLELQDEHGHPTAASDDFKPVLNSEGLQLSYADIESRQNTLIIKGVVAIGTVNSQHGKNFIMTVILPTMKRELQSMKVRLLPGQPHALLIDDRNDDKNDVDDDSDEIKCFDIENLSSISLRVHVVDVAGNVTLGQKLIVQAKFPSNSGVPALTCDCSESGRGTLSGRIAMKKLKKEKKSIKVKIEVVGNKDIKPCFCQFNVSPSTNVKVIEVFYTDPYSDDSDLIKLKMGSDIYWQAGEIMSDMSFRLLDEARREVVLNKNVCSGIRVNWTNHVSSEDLCSGKLPDITIPTNVRDTKYCEIIYAGQKNIDFSFNIKPIAGEPAAIKCTVVGSRDIQLGITKNDPITVSLLDSHGNKLNVRESQLDLVRVSAEGLDETLIEKNIVNNTVHLNNIQFNQGPLGSREICVMYGHSEPITEYVLLQIIAGTPVMIDISGWSDFSKPVAVLSGTRIQEEIKVQLLDGWGNAARQKGVKVLLGKDSAVKLTPNPGMLLTDIDGVAVFKKFSVSGKRGEYNLQPRVVVNRTSIEGPKLKISILPNTETPTCIKVFYDQSIKSVVTGTTWPDFEVNVQSEEGMPVTSSVHICMAVWKGKPLRDKSVPLSAEFHRINEPSQGVQNFNSYRAPTIASSYSICFCLCDSPNSRNFLMVSEIIKINVVPGPPYRLQHEVDPGTPTVSNTKVARTIIRNLTLVLEDKFGNSTGHDVNGQVTVIIETSEQTLKSAEVPKFDGNCARLEMPMKNGKIVMNNLTLQENSPGTDGSQYVLHCELTSKQLPEQLPPYMLKFFFYNDSFKQTQMSVLAKKRDVLKNAINSYESLFNLHHTLLNELKKTFKDADNKKKQLLRDLQRANMKTKEISSTADVESLIRKFSRERDVMLNQPRRKCLLKEYPDKSTEILGKIGHLAQVSDDAIACVLSWHMMGDMDCLVTFTSKKAREVHKATGGTQQLLPLDSIYKKNLPDPNRPLPHLRRPPSAGGFSNAKGNPVYARDLLYFPKDPDNCKIVFGMLLGETLIIDDLDTANEYRNKVVKFTYCPTILTRNGERIRSNGKFGGNQNKAVSIDRLRGAVFGAMLPEECSEIEKQIELLRKYKESLDETDTAFTELNNHESSLQTDEMIQKKHEHKEAIERLKEIEKKIGLTRSSAPRQKMDSGTPSKRRRR
ncbi:structural maintenance of chromosomes flexible hinge domain-containing protein 1-like isoform X2 [Styela clava]